MSTDQPTATATPRTDANTWTGIGAWDEDSAPLRECVTADFARTLERELSSAQAALAEAKAEIELSREATVIDGEKRYRCTSELAFAIQAMKERYEAELGALHGRIGLFAAKWYLINDNLPTNETFAQMEEQIADAANKHLTLMAECDQLRAMLAKCAPLDVSERAELGRLRDREEISKATNDQLRARVAELEKDIAGVLEECAKHITLSNDFPWSEEVYCTFHHFESELKAVRKQANDEFDAIITRNMELEADKARLDWLLSRGVCWRGCNAELMGEGWAVGHETEWLYNVQGQGRARIDKGIAARAGKGAT